MGRGGRGGRARKVACGCRKIGCRKIRSDRTARGEQGRERTQASEGGNKTRGAGNTRRREHLEDEDAA